MKFAQNLKNLRKERQLTYESLAKKIGYSKAIIGFWENEQKQPNMEALIALADFFNVSIDFLVGREDEFGNKTSNSTYNNFGIHTGDVKF